MKKSTVKALSFIGGLVFFSAVAAAVVLKNEKLRNELEAQANKLVEAGKGVADQVAFVVGKINSITANLNSAKESSNLLAGEQDPELDAYNMIWAEAEKSVAGQ